MSGALLVIGYGSIGARHSRLAVAMGASVACVTANAGAPFPRFACVADALTQFQPDYVLIANPTDHHVHTLDELEHAQFSGRVLIEKPLSDVWDACRPLPRMQAFIAYNLRFHPLVQCLRACLGTRPLYSASFYAGQHLPQWRPGTDYRRAYSAQRDQGGGVLRDLSHELDLALWLCGAARRVAALGGHFSALEIDSDDVFSILSSHDRCPAVSITINYLDQIPHRSIIINAQGLTAHLDFLAGTLNVNGENMVYNGARDSTYAAQLQAFLGGDAGALCSFSEGQQVMRFIAAIEEASASQNWLRLQCLQ